MINMSSVQTGVVDTAMPVRHPLREVETLKEFTDSVEKYLLTVFSYIDSGNHPLNNIRLKEIQSLRELHIKLMNYRNDMISSCEEYRNRLGKMSSLEQSCRLWLLSNRIKMADKHIPRILHKLTNAYGSIVPWREIIYGQTMMEELADSFQGIET